MQQKVEERKKPEELDIVLRYEREKEYLDKLIK